MVVVAGSAAAGALVGVCAIAPWLAEQDSRATILSSVAALAVAVISSLTAIALTRRYTVRVSLISDGKPVALG
jgi:hypothetical protein